MSVMRLNSVNYVSEEVGADKMRIKISPHTHTNTVICVSPWGSVIGMDTGLQQLPSNSVVDPGRVCVPAGCGRGKPRVRSSS